MKKTILTFCVCLMLITSCLTSCHDSIEYVPAGEFYLKTSPANGDAGVENVISLEADSKTYDGDGDITVPMTVGLGHLPDAGGYGDDAHDTFYVRYRIIESPFQAYKEPVWEKKVEYSDSWYDSKYDSTEQINPPSLIFARYGEFYPLYSETVDFVFPADTAKGYVQISITIVMKGREDYTVADFKFYFERVDGVLTLDP